MFNKKLSFTLFVSSVFMAFTFAQSPIISGTVLDFDTQKPLEGVTIALAGSENIYTTTKADGTFSLEAKGRKNGTAAHVDCIAKNYKQTFMQMGTAVLLGDKSATKLKIEMTSSEAKQLDALLTAHQKMINNKIRVVQMQIDALPQKDNKRVILQDSIYMTCNAAEGEQLTLPELLSTTAAVLSRPLSAVGLRAKTQWNEGNLDAALTLLEEAKVMENWKKAIKNAAPTTNAAYNDAALFALFCGLNRYADTKKTNEAYQHLFAADTTNSEAAIFVAEQYAGEEDYEKAVKYYEIATRNSLSDVIKVTYMSLSLILKDKYEVETTKTKKNTAKNLGKATETVLQNIQNIIKNSHKGSEEAVLIYKSDLFLQAGMMGLLLTKHKSHLDYLTSLGKEVSKSLLPCTVHRYVYDVLGLMHWLYEDRQDKYSAAVEELGDYYGDCAKKTPTFMQLKQHATVLKVKQSAVTTAKLGFRETEVLYTKRLAVERLMAERFPWLCQNSEMRLYSDFATFAAGTEQESMILKTNLNAINAFNAAMQTNYAANAAPFLQLITDFDKTAKDSTKLRIYKKEIAIFEPLAAKNSIAFQPTLTELYLYYGDVLAHDTLRKAEAAAMYEKGVAMTIPLYENYPQSYGGILQTVCGTVASYYTNEKQIDKAIAIYTTMIEKTKKVYQAEHKGNEYYLLLAYNNLSSLYKAELYDKDNAEYRKKAKIMLAEMDKIVVEGGLDFQPFYKQMEEDKYEGDEDEYTIESFVPTMYRLKNFFELTSPADALLIGQLTDIRTKLDSAKTEERHEECIRLLNEDLKISAILVKNIKYSNTFEAQAADSNGSLSWQLLFTKQYAASEAAAKVAIAYKDPKTKEASAEWANTNLAIAYILQDKYSDALKIYKKYKGKIYGLTDANWTETFLQDLDTMEKSGITHKDFAQARKYLQK